MLSRAAQPVAHQRCGRRHRHGECGGRCLPGGQGWDRWAGGTAAPVAVHLDLRGAAGSTAETPSDVWTSLSLTPLRLVRVTGRTDIRSIAWAQGKTAALPNAPASPPRDPRH